MRGAEGPDKRGAEGAEGWRSGEGVSLSSGGGDWVGAMPLPNKFLSNSC